MNSAYVKPAGTRQQIVFTSVQVRLKDNTLRAELKEGSANVRL